MKISILDEEKWIGNYNNKDYIFKNIWGESYFKFRVINYKITGIEIRIYEKNK
jgi:hypothetical protein